LYVRLLCKKTGLDTESSALIKKSLNDIIDKLTQILQIIREFTAPAAPTVEKEGLAKQKEALLTNLGNLVGLTIRTGAAVFPGNQDQADNLTDYIAMLIDINNALVQKKFTNAVLTGYALMDKALNKNFPNQYAALMNDKVTTTINFFVSLISAKTGEDVYNIIDAAAAPVGSYIKKKEKAGYLTVNGYAGMNLNWNFKDALFNDESGAAFNTNSFEIFMPLGLEIGSHWFGLLVAPFDLGGLIKFGFMGNLWDYNTTGAGLVKVLEANNPQTINFQTILAPSASLVFRFTDDLPLTIGVGYQFIPNLQATTGVFTVHKIIVFAAMDIVLYLFE